MKKDLKIQDPHEALLLMKKEEKKRKRKLKKVEISRGFVLTTDKAKWEEYNEKK